MTLSRSFALILSASSFGCAGGESVERSNDLPICVYSEPPVAGEDGSADYMADAILHAQASLGCMGCMEDVELECTIEQTNGTIELTAHGQWIASDGPCDAVCGTKTATCETANPVSAGTFEVVYGGAAAQTLVIPADDPEAEPVCFE